VKGGQAVVEDAEAVEDAETEPQEAAQVSPQEVAARTARAARHRSLLQEIRGSEAGQKDPRVQGRESREELLHRLLDPLLTLEETSRLLGVCPTTVRRYTNKGQLKHLRTQGNQRRFRFSDVMEFLESRGDEVEADRLAESSQ